MTERLHRVLQWATEREAVHICRGCLSLVPIMTDRSLSRACPICGQNQGLVNEWIPKGVMAIIDERPWPDTPEGVGEGRGSLTK
jgi:RNA polymerase subunit RPABC4/transcription elongation factor Spt4